MLTICLKMNILFYMYYNNITAITKGTFAGILSFVLMLLITIILFNAALENDFLVFLFFLLSVKHNQLKTNTTFLQIFAGNCTKTTLEHTY